MEAASTEQSLVALRAALLAYYDERTSVLGRGPSGPAPRLSDAQLATVEQALLEGAGANGLVGELWPWSGSRWSSSG